MVPGILGLDFDRLGAAGKAMRLGILNLAVPGIGMTFAPVGLNACMMNKYAKDAPMAETDMRRRGVPDLVLHAPGAADRRPRPAPEAGASGERRGRI